MNAARTIPFPADPPAGGSNKWRAERAESSRHRARRCFLQPIPPRLARRASARRRTGMTLVELLLASVAIAIIFGGLILASQSLRNDACDRKTRSTLRQLRGALQAYYDRHNSWPPEPTTHAALSDLLADTASAPFVRSLDLRTDDRGQMCILDGYGQAVRYVIQSGHDAAGADFVSAGPNGRFGDLTSENRSHRQDAADNLYGWDLETPTP